MLNSNQQQAVESNDKNILVLAGAGSGKTTVLISRISRLVEEAINPGEIKACIPNRYNKKEKNSVNPQQTSESPTDTLSIGSKNLEDMIASADAVLRDKLGNGIAEQRKRKLCRKDKYYG